MNHFVEKFKE